MAYTAFYRKLRPKTFDDVIGQEHIVRTLKNQINEGRIPHAYLFCGTRGTGKTSSAKIFAKAVNCKNPKDASPCCECDSCTGIDRQLSMDVIEIDAASNNSVDDIRVLREEVKYPPVYGKYKVYIIDEVHMLSISAFNALLKTLEEPPEHVIFILATTDPQKIPVTIHSRCQRFDFKRISSRDMTEAIGRYMEAEGISITQDALRYITQISDGAMRDALSLLDQCAAMYYNEEITLDKVLDTVGSADSSVFFALAEHLYNVRTHEIMMLIDEIILNGRDISQFISDATMHFRNLLIAKTADKSQSIFDLSPENIKKLKEQSALLSSDALMKYIRAFSELQNTLKYTDNKRILLEVMCIKLCAPVEETFKPQTQPKKATSPAKVKVIPDDIKEAVAKWSDFVDSLEIAEKAYFSTAKAEYLDNSILSIVFESSPIMDLINTKEKDNKFLTEKLKKFFGKEFDIRLTVKKDFDAQHQMLYNTVDFDTVQDKITGMSVEII